MNSNLIKIIDVYNSYVKHIEIYLKPTSILNIKRKFKLHILPIIGKINIYEFSDEDYLYWQNYIKSLNFSSSFNKSIQSIFKKFFDYIVINYNVKNIPRKNNDFKNFNNIKNNKVLILSINDFKKIMKVSKNDILYNTLFEFLYFTGVRKGELLALNWNDFKNNYIVINKTITKEFFNGKRIITSPKTENSNRVIMIDKKLSKKLNNLKKYYIKHDINFNNNYFIFGGNKPIPTTTLERKKNYYCDKANIKRIRIHDFRHSHATLLYKNHCDIKTIQKRLGHSNIETTLNTYINYNNEKRVQKTLNFIRLIF